MTKPIPPLEDARGMRVFEREGQRRARPAAPGEIFVVTARRALAESASR